MWTDSNFEGSLLAIAKMQIRPAGSHPVNFPPVIDMSMPPPPRQDRLYVIGSMLGAIIRPSAGIRRAIAPTDRADFHWDTNSPKMIDYLSLLLNLNFACRLLA